MNMHETVLFGGIILNIIITAGGFVRMAQNYEHRMTKLETEMRILLSKVERSKGGKDEHDAN